MKRVMVFGTFDILHPGHIYFLKQAKKYGDFLIVSIAREKYVEKIKGHAAIHSERQRQGLLRALRMVDRVVMGSRDDYLSHIVKEHPQVIVLGYDQKYFTKNLAGELAKKGLSVKIFRAGPYQKNVYKTSKLWRKILN